VEGPTWVEAPAADRFYADPQVARAFRYDAEDIAAPRNEEQAARTGCAPRSRILSPAKPLPMAQF